ncbi:MAG TPA: hypothetical protein VMZ30_01865 [Pyrinomonadaceae bacterium]|nr:hypothetical protein [Pyrinomonadaceae bacterium]
MNFRSSSTETNKPGVRRNRTLCGMLARKERWGLTWRGWLAAVVLILALTLFVGLTIHPFLAPTERLSARLLVIEGWSPPSTMNDVAAEFRSGNYDQVILVRPLFDAPDDYESGLSYGKWLAQLLITKGVPESNLATLYPKVAQKDRTYHAALAVKAYLAERQLNFDSLNLITTGPHARRSRLLYKKAFAPDVKIGIIALEEREYDSRHWWRTSAGVREVIGQTVAYLYARCFFKPAL